MILRVLLLAIPATFLVHQLAGDRTTLLFFCSIVAMIPASLYIEKSTDSLATYLGQSVEDWSTRRSGTSRSSSSAWPLCGWACRIS